MDNPDGVFEKYFSLHLGQRYQWEGTYYFRILVSSPENRQKLFALHLHRNHFVIESRLQNHIFPARLSLLHVYPTQVLNYFFIFVDTSINKQISSEHACGVILPGFSEIPRCLQNSPLILLSIVERDVWVETPVFEFLFVLTDSPKKNQVSLVTAQSVSISWNWTVHRLRLDLWPFLFLMLIKEGFDSFFKYGLARNSPINIDSVFQLAVSNVITRATWRVILIDIANRRTD